MKWVTISTGQQTEWPTIHQQLLKAKANNQNVKLLVPDNFSHSAVFLVEQVLPSLMHPNSYTLIDVELVPTYSNPVVNA